jgi:acyl dehydratase
MQMLFEELKPGVEFEVGRARVDKSGLRAFATARGFERDDLANQWFLVALQLQIIVVGFFNRSHSQGSPGLEEVWWRGALQHGDTLCVRCTVLESRISRSKRMLGLVRFRFDAINQRDEPLLSVRQWAMFSRAHVHHGELQGHASVGTGALAPTEESLPHARPTAKADCWKHWLQPRPGLVAELGSFKFDAVDIIGFARTYDPQPFHVDEDAARASVFGQLCASGLQSSVVWAALAQHGPWELPPTRMSDLIWRRPIFAGEAIRFRSTIRSFRPGDKLPDAIRIQRLNEALDSTGAVVMHFGDEVVLRAR